MASLNLAARPRQSWLTIRPYTLFRWISILALVLGVVVGIPQLGVALALPWLSVEIVRRPALLLAAYLYVPLYKSLTLTLMPIDLTVWLAVLCIVATLVKIVETRVIPFASASIFWFVFVILLVITTISSSYFQTSFQTLISTVALTIVPLLLALWVGRSRVDLEKFLHITLAASVVYCIVGIGLLAWDDTGRLAFSSNTIGAGRIAIMGLLVAPIVIKPTRWQTLKIVGVALITVSVSLASGSRGPLLAAFVAIAAIYILPNRWIALRLLAAALSSLIGIVVIMSSWVESVIPAHSLDRIRQLIETLLTLGDLESLSPARITMFRNALIMWDQRLWTGWGPGAYSVITDPSGLIEVTSHDYVHNSVLQAASEMGTFGLLWLLLFMGTAITFIYARINDSVVKGVGILMIFAVVSSFVSNDLYDNRWMWGMLLLAVSVNSLSRTKSTPVPDCSLA